MAVADFSLAGKVAIVTGGRRGLGQSMAWGLAEAGADIVCVSKSGQADETRRLVESAGRRFFDINDLTGARISSLVGAVLTIDERSESTNLDAIILH